VDLQPAIAATRLLSALMALIDVFPNWLMGFGAGNSMQRS